MDDVGLEPFSVLLRHESVLLAVKEAQLVLAVETHEPVGVPVAGLHPPLADVVAPTDGETVVRSVLQIQLLDSRHELVGEPLIGIETEHPVVLGMLQRQVLLRTVADVGVYEDTRAGFFR